MAIINIGSRLLVIIVLSVLLDFSVLATETGSYYRQVKNIIPRITRNNLGITCEKSRSYSFEYLIKAGKNAHPTRNFPLKFGVFKYEIEGPYYLYPIYIGERYYNEGPIGEDFVVINSQRFILGGVTVRMIYNELNYYPCLPQKTQFRLTDDDTILNAMEAAVDNPGSSSSESNTVGVVDDRNTRSSESKTLGVIDDRNMRSGESKTVGVIDGPKKELVVTQDETGPQDWNPFMPMKYWKFEGQNLFN